MAKGERQRLRTYTNPPALGQDDAALLAPGMCFSNEPTIGLPDRFSVRLENYCYMADDGPSWFTQQQVAVDAPFE